MRLKPLQTLLAAALLSCLSAGPAIAAEESYRLTVSAGKHDRLNVPVRVLIPASAGAKSVALTTADGKPLAAQLTAPGLLSDTAKEKRELHFILQLPEAHGGPFDRRPGGRRLRLQRPARRVRRTQPR